MWLVVPGIGEDAAALQRAVQHRDQAFADRQRRVVLRQAELDDAGIGHDRNRAGALVLDRLRDGEQEVLVDREGALEDEAGAVVPGQRHRMIDRERAAVGLPDRVEGRQLHAGIAGGEAGFGEMRLRAARGAEQHDLRARGVDGVVIVLHHQVVEPAAFQGDRAVERGVSMATRGLPARASSRVLVGAVLPALGAALGAAPLGALVCLLLLRRLFLGQLRGRFLLGLLLLFRRGIS